MYRLGDGAAQNGAAGEHLGTDCGWLAITGQAGRPLEFQPGGTAILNPKVVTPDDPTPIPLVAQS